MFVAIKGLKIPPVLWSDHHLLKAWVVAAVPLCTGGGLVQMVHPWKLNDLLGLQNVLSNVEILNGKAAGPLLGV